MLLSTLEESSDLVALLHRVRCLVFDLNSLPAMQSGGEWEFLTPFFQVLLERDYHLTVVWENPDYPTEWRNQKKLTVVRIPRSKDDPDL